VRQLIISPRWIVWHVLTLGAVITCGWLAAWQWERAGSAMGSALNIGYGLQWPFFALFFAVMWWRLLRMEAAKLADGEAGTESASDPVQPTRPGPVAADRPPGPTGPASGVRRAATDPVPDAPAPSPSDPSPFGPRPAAARLDPVTDDEDPELAQYNRMLARLAARDADG
jgi:hypothetical protein